MTYEYCNFCNDRFIPDDDCYINKTPVCSYCLPRIKICLSCGGMHKLNRISNGSLFVCKICVPRSCSGFTNAYLRTRFEILRRDGFACRYCGLSPLNDVKVKLHIDHITPVSKGGLDNIENLIASCSHCNAGKIDILLSESEINKLKERKIYDKHNSATKGTRAYKI